MTYQAHDKKRKTSIKSSGTSKEPYRSEWRRDYARLIHAPSFRRLKDKTQLYPGKESDFFRNRLTHSLEVAQIAKSIANRLNHIIKDKKLGNYEINTDIVEFASLAHDLGHPPFGHLGEKALDECMINFGGFEGNAQTLRLLTKIEKRQHDGKDKTGFRSSGLDKRFGLNPTFRSLASIIKYDFEIPKDLAGRRVAYKNEQISKLSPVKGYYYSETDLVVDIKQNLLNNPTQELYSIECRIMDLADDIAYSTYDLEDSFKAGFIKPLDVVTADDTLLKVIAKKLNKRLNLNLDHDDIREVLKNIFYKLFDSVEITDDIEIDNELIQELSFTAMKTAVDTSNDIAENGYSRSQFTSELIGRFIRGVEIDTGNINTKDPILSDFEVDENVKIEIETLKNFTFQSQILSPKLKIVEYRGKKIIKELFEILSSNGNHELMPEDFAGQYSDAKDKPSKMRCICDFLACMTDGYAVEYYERLTSTNPQTIFKPH